MSILLFQQTLASLFKRKSKDVLQAKELELLASMELRWFEPADARKLVEIALSLGLLEETEAGLIPKFEFETLEIPIGFQPPKDLLSELEHEHESLFMRMVNRISLATGMESTQIISEINQKQAEKQEYLTLDVLAILYGKAKDVDMDKYMPEVENKILSGSS